MFCNVGVDSVIAAPDVDNIYRLPMVFSEQDLDDRILAKLGIWAGGARLQPWHELMDRIDNARHSARIGIVGKYVNLSDTYKSLNEALRHGGFANDARVDLKFIDSELLSDPDAELSDCDAILVPGGFGKRGAEGKIDAIRWARESGTPFFGICLGMQLAVVEFCRNVLGLTGAQSREFSTTAEHIVVELMDEQRQVTDKGGTMRLGAWPCRLRAGSLVSRIYGQDDISERHRHRYEINPSYFKAVEEAGMSIAGRSPKGLLAEMIELSNHPYFVACQFHPEFKSRPLHPHPLFAAFIKAALDHQSRREGEAAAR